MKKTFFSRLRLRFFTAKWLVFLVSAAVLVFFGRVTDNKSLTQSAIVVGLGIDYAENTFEVSAQTALISSSAGGSDAVTVYAVYREKGVDVSEAIDKIAQKTGLIVSLSHCNVVFVTQSALLAEGVQIFAPLVETYSLPEQAILASCEGAPSDMLAAKVASAATVPFYVQAALQQNLGSSSPVTVKDYAAYMLSPSGCAFIPVFAAAESAYQPQLPDGEGEGYSDVFATGCLVVTADGGFFLDEELSKAASLVTDDDFSDNFSVVMPDGLSAEFAVTKADCSVKANGADVSLGIKLTVSLVHADSADGQKITTSSEETLAAADKLARDVAALAESCFALCRENGADVFRIGNEIYKKEGRGMPSDYLSRLRFSATAEVTVHESS